MSDANEVGNRRAFTRVTTHPEARLSSRVDEGDWAALVLDVSLRGLLLEGECAIDLGTEVSVQIVLGEDSDGLAIDAVGAIVRIDARGTAVELTEIEDLASFEHLRNLILYNSTTPEPIEEEFRQHVGISRDVGESR